MEHACTKNVLREQNAREHFTTFLPRCTSTSPRFANTSPRFGKHATLRARAFSICKIHEKCNRGKTPIFGAIFFFSVPFFVRIEFA
jgi:hypothetical protein